MCVQCDVGAAGGMYLNIFVIVVCFIASVMLFLLINVFLFVHSYCKTCCADFLLTRYTNLHYHHDY